MELNAKITAKGSPKTLTGARFYSDVSDNNCKNIRRQQAVWDKLTLFWRVARKKPVAQKHNKLE